MPRVFNWAFLQQRRLERGWSTLELAEKAGFGNSETVRRLEAGETNPRMATVKKLCEVFPECKPEDFYKSEADEPSTRPGPSVADAATSANAVRGDEPFKKTGESTTAGKTRDSELLQAIKQHSEGSAALLEQFLARKDRLVILATIKRLGIIIAETPDLAPTLGIEIASLARQLGSSVRSAPEPTPER